MGEKEGLMATSIFFEGFVGVFQSNYFLNENKSVPLHPNSIYKVKVFRSIYG